MKKVLSLMLAFAMIFAIVPMSALTASAYESSMQTTAKAGVITNTYFDKVVSYINTYGIYNSDGYKTIIRKRTGETYTFYFCIENRGNGIYFEMLNSSNESSYIATIIEFILYKNDSNINVDFSLLYYYDYECIDAIKETKILNRSTYTPDNVYTLYNSGDYITNSDFSDCFNLALKALCGFWDGHFYTELGFGLEQLGFINFPGYGYAVCDPATNYHSGYSEVRNKREPSCFVGGYTGDTYCSVCGKKMSTGKAVSAYGSHTYDDSCDDECNRCGEIRDAGHNFAGGDTCFNCGKTESQLVSKDDPTLVKENKDWYYTINGQKVNATTLVKYKGTWYYVKNGRLNTSNTLVEYNGIWYNVKNGKINFDATTLVKYGNTWYYVKGGKLSNDNTLVKYNGVWYHVKNGKLASDTTLVKYKGSWYYVKGGKLSNDNTLVKYNNVWYNVKNGKLASDTTLVKYGNTWYYVKNGKMNTSNTLVNYKGVWYHVKGGKMVSDTTLVKYGNTWIYVKNGKKCTDNTLVKYNNVWFHVKNGTLANDTTLVKYGSKWYYVKNGKVDFKANTKIKFGGKWYTIRGGVVK